MNENPFLRNPEALLVHDNFVRGLAKSLLFDEHEVDDIVQKTWLAAIQRPPQKSGSIRAWLNSVVRNQVAALGRREGRLDKRERKAARPEALASTSELFERESARKEVVNSVLKLDEPYRSIILFRFYEDLPPREIAQRMGDPVETVRTRIKRGLELLRSKLDDNHGGNRQAWCLGLIPFAAAKTLKVAALGGVSVATLGGIIMSWKVKSLLAALLLLALGSGFWFLKTEKAQLDTAVVVSTSNEKQNGEPQAIDESRRSDEESRTKLELPTAKSPKASNQAREEKIFEEVTLNGKILDTEGKAIAGAFITLSEAGSAGGDYQVSVEALKAEAKSNPKFIYAATSLDDGQFTFKKIPDQVQWKTKTVKDPPERTLRLCAAAKGYTAEYSDPIPLSKLPLQNIEIRLAAGFEITGQVFDDEKNRPLGDARVFYSLLMLSEGKPRGISGSVHSNSEGKFILPPLPIRGQLGISASEEGYEQKWVQLNMDGGESISPLEIRLKKSERLIRGRILTTERKPLPFLLSNPSDRSNLGHFSVKALRGDVVPLLKNPNDFRKLDRFPYTGLGDYHEEDGAFTIRIPDFWKNLDCSVLLILNDSVIEAKRVVKLSEELEFVVDVNSLVKQTPRLVLRVIDGNTGKSISSRLSVSLFDNLKTLSQLATSIHFYSRPTDGTGIYFIPFPGVYDVHIEADGYGFGILEKMEFVAGETRGPITVKLFPGLRVRGKAEFEGKPLPRGILHVSDSEDRMVASAELSSDGSFVLEGMVPGKYQIQHMGSFTNAYAEIEILPGSENVLQVSFLQCTFIQFKFPESLKKNAINGSLSILNSSGRVLQFEMIEDPKRAHATLNQGKYRLRFGGNDGQSIERDFTVQAEDSGKQIQITIE